MYSGSTTGGAAVAIARTALVTAALGGSASVGAKAEATAPVATTAASCPFEPASGGWWAGFNDTVLNLLHAMAAGRGARATTRNDDCAPAALTVAYVQLRVLSLRLTVLQSMLATANRQSTLIGSGSGSGNGNATADSSRDVLARRVESITTQIRNLQLLRLHFLQVLSQQTGLPEMQMTEVLRPTLREQTVPRFFMNLPARLPAELLRQRSDVAHLERQLTKESARSPAAAKRLADYTRGLDGWILAEGADSDTAAQDAPAADADADLALLQRSRTEVAQDLRDLSERAKAVSMLGQLVDNRRAEFELTRQRQQMGQASELESTERYFVMLADTDRLAAVNGELALAWIGLQRSTGGSVGKDAAGDGARAHPEPR
jgi:outer membrane protein TolC